MSTNPADLNSLALGALDGSNFQDSADYINTLCRLLRSKVAISREVREELAAALERGKFGLRLQEFNQYGDLKPRLRVEEVCSAKMRDAVRTRYKWLDAGEAVFDAREDGLRGDDAIFSVGKQFGLGFDAMRKYALPFYREFLAEIDKAEWLTPEQAVSEWVLQKVDASGVDEHVREAYFEDGNKQMKSYFVWAKADQFINGLAQPRGMDQWSW